MVDREHFRRRQPQVLADGQLSHRDALRLGLVVRQPLHPKATEDQSGRT